MKDIVGNKLQVGDLCYYIKSGTQFNIALVEVTGFKNGFDVFVKVVKSNASIEQWRGVSSWKDGYVPKPLGRTNLIKVYGGVNL